MGPGVLSCSASQAVDDELAKMWYHLAVASDYSGRFQGDSPKQALRILLRNGHGSEGPLSNWVNQALYSRFKEVDERWDMR